MSDDPLIFLAKAEIEAMRRLVELEGNRWRRLRARVVDPTKSVAWFEDEEEEDDEEALVALTQFMPTPWWWEGYDGDD
jgi:hypothetical protein